MKFNSIAEFDEWITDQLKARKQRNVDDMIADGCSQEAIDAMAARFDVEAYRDEAVAALKRLLDEPNAPTHTMQ